MKLATALKLIPIFISICALGISAWSLFRTRKRIVVTFSENLELVNKNDLTTDYEGEFPIGLPDDVYMTSISIVNHSPADIGFFDLRAFNVDDNNNDFLVTNKSTPQIEGEKIFRKYTDGNSAIIDHPEKNHGIFKSNSFKRMDLIVLPKNNIPHDIGISFKIPVSTHLKFRRDPFSVTNRRKFKFYGKIFQHQYVSNNTQIDNNNATDDNPNVKLK